MTTPRRSNGGGIFGGADMRASATVCGVDAGAGSSRISGSLRAIAGSVLLLVFGMAIEANAQSAYPRKPITYIVPYGPGSGNDVIARIVAKKIGDNWGHNIVVVNRAGATGGIALEATANAAPDGHTMVIASTSQIINQHLSKVRYDFVRDFAPVSLSGNQPYAVSVLKSFPVSSMKELVALARAHPGKMNYTGTIGSIAHFMGWMLKSQNKIDIVMIPNKLAAEAEADVLAGRIEIWFATASTTTRQARAGKVKVLAVSGGKRLPELPGTPTMAEAGYADAGAVANYFVLVPVATPKTVVAQLSAEFVKAIAATDVRERLQAGGVEPTSSTPDEAAKIVRGEVEHWGRIVREAGISID